MRKWVLNMIPTLESEKKITCDLCILSKQPEIKNKNIENPSKTHMSEGGDGEEGRREGMGEEGGARSPKNHVLM